MKSDPVELQVSDGVAWLRLNRPEALNALNLECVERLGVHLADLREREDVRVIVTRGAGRAFCAGSDVRELAGKSAAEAAAVEKRHSDVLALLDELPQVSIAMLHGYALGGGLGTALYHDFRIAAADATLGMPEVKLGWPPPWAVARLVEIAGHASAAWLLLAGERITGERAAALGIVNEAVPADQLETRVRALAQNIAQMPREAVAGTKRLLAALSPFRDPKWDAAANAAFKACLELPRAQASLAAFAAPRKKA